MHDSVQTTMRRFVEYFIIAAAAVAITVAVTECVHGRDWRAAHDARHETERRLDNESDQGVLDDVGDARLRAELRAIERRYDGTGAGDDTGMSDAAGGD